MRVRNPGMPVEPPGGRDPGPGSADLTAADRDDAGPAVGGAGGVHEVVFAVPSRVVVAKFAVAALLGLVALVAPNRPQMLIGLLAAGAVTAYAARDVLSRQRLRANADGIVAASGYLGRRRLAWSQIERVRVDETTRLGARTEMLELDAGDEIFLFSWFDLGVEPAEAVRALDVVRQAGGQASDPGR